MRKISESDLGDLLGDELPPLVAKSENDNTESAVALKRLPSCFVLGISCDLDDRLELYAIDDEASAWNAYECHCALMDHTGRPFADSV